MLYAIFCYDSEEEVCAWSAEQDAAVMASLGAVQDRLSAQGRLGPVARLAPTKQAKTIRKGKEAMVLDGPFAETKEQLLGFYIIDCATPDDALEVAQELGRASGSSGAFEVRPLTLYRPGGGVAVPVA
jgi:hypothetical protein